jgi:hypothetical protein
MLGNVFEWIDGSTIPNDSNKKYFASIMNPPPGPNDPWYETRGLSFKYPKLEKSALWEPAAAPANYRADDLGFRCVMDPPSK